MVLITEQSSQMHPARTDEVSASIARHFICDSEYLTIALYEHYETHHYFCPGLPAARVQSTCLETARILRQAIRRPRSDRSLASCRQNDRCHKRPSTWESSHASRRATASCRQLTIFGLSIPPNSFLGRIRPVNVGRAPLRLHLTLPSRMLVCSHRKLHRPAPRKGPLQLETKRSQKTPSADHVGSCYGRTRSVRTNGVSAKTPPFFRPRNLLGRGSAWRRGGFMGAHGRRIRSVRTSRVCTLCSSADSGSGPVCPAKRFSLIFRALRKGST